MDANSGVFEAILSQQDVIIADRLIHASLVDGIRLCSAEYDTFKHMDMKHLENKLILHQDKRTRLVVTDGVFSMDGDLAPLDQMCALCDKYDAMILVDESHASGFIGKTGPRHPRAFRRDGQGSTSSPPPSARALAAPPAAVSRGGRETSGTLPAEGKAVPLLQLHGATA